MEVAIHTLRHLPNTSPTSFTTTPCRIPFTDKEIFAQDKL
jgi:hypothetical protein